MGRLLLHSLDTVWTTSNGGVLSVAVDGATTVDGSGSNRLAATAAAQNAYVEWTPPLPIDLSGFDELRFWVLGTRRAEGTAAAPFQLELSFTDVNDEPSEQHRWYVPVNRGGVWEQRRIGIARDRRSAVNRVRFTCLTALPFTCFLDELLAVREEMLRDVESELALRLGVDVAVPGATAVPLSQTANIGDTQIVLPLSTEFASQNRIVLGGGVAAPEEHTVVVATHDTGAGTTTLEFDGADAVVATRLAATGRVTLLVPVLPDDGGFIGELAGPRPAIHLTLLESREDALRTSIYTQRDSFRPRPGGMASSVRPSAQAYFVDYQITARASSRRQQLFLQTHLLRRLHGFAPTSLADAFRINGAPAPVVQLPSPPLDERQLGDPAPLYLRVHTRMEVAPRTEVLGVQAATVAGGQLAGLLPGSGQPQGEGTEVELPLAPVAGPEPGLPPGLDPGDTEAIVIQIGSV